MSNTVVVDPAPLRNIHSAVVEFRDKISRLQSEATRYLADKKSEMHEGFDRKTRKFDEHEREREERLRNAEEDKQGDISTSNEAERNKELDELEKCAQMIQQFDRTSEAYIATLNELGGTCSGKVSGALSRINICISTLESYIDPGYGSGAFYAAVSTRDSGGDDSGSDSPPPRRPAGSPRERYLDRGGRI